MSDSADPAAKRVLVVDDDESMREFFELAAKREGFQVETAADGQEALTTIARNPPDLVLLDLMLPRYGGFEVLRQLQQGETANIPILVVTGRHMDGAAQDMIRQESNVADFLEKPIRPVKLAAAMHRCLKTKPREPQGS